jgi:hypothetical protein
MTLERSYKGYLGFLGTDLFKSVLKYSNGPICLIKLLFKMGLFTVYEDPISAKTPENPPHCHVPLKQYCFEVLVMRESFTKSEIFLRYTKI